MLDPDFDRISEEAIMATTERVDLEQRVREALDRWDLTDSPLAAGALDVVERLKNPQISPTAASMMHAQLRAYLADLQKLAPLEETDDGVDEVKGKRDQRRREAGLG